MIHDDEIDEVAIEEVEDEREPTGFELDALLIERAAAEAADLEEERHNAFMDRVRAWAYDPGDGSGVEVPGNLIMASRDAIDEYFAGCYRTAHSPRMDGDEVSAPPPPKTTPKQPTVRSAQGVRPLGLPIRPTPPEPPPEPGYKPPIGTAGGFKARAARTTRALPANFSGPVGLPEMIPSDRWEIR